MFQIKTFQFFVDKIVKRDDLPLKFSFISPKAYENLLSYTIVFFT